MLCGLSLGLLCYGAPASAQNCDTVVEEIIKLRPAAFDNYTVWDEVHGKEGMEQIFDMTVLYDGSVVGVGSYTKDEKDSVYKPYLVHMTPKGEALWETHEEENTYKTINRIIPYKKGYLVVGDVNREGRGNGIYIAQYGDNGKRLTQWGIYEPKGNLDAKGLAVSEDGKSILIAAQLNPLDDFKGQYGILYKYSLSGKRIWRHGYSPGSRSLFNNLQKFDGIGFILSGGLQIEDGRMAGWLLRVDDNGAIMWQRSYARGDYSELLSAATTEEGGLIVGGKAKPIGSKRYSGWVIKTDVSGNEEWQRYYAGPYDYSAAGVLPYEDGRIAVLLDARQKSLLDRSHARLLTLSPRGYLMNVEEFSDGQAAQAVRLIKGPKEERVMAGWVQSSYADVSSVDAIPANTYDAWLLAAPALDPYEDPCKPKSYLP